MTPSKLRSALEKYIEDSGELIVQLEGCPNPHHRNGCDDQNRKELFCSCGLDVKRVKWQRLRITKPRNFKMMKKFEHFFLPAGTIIKFNGLPFEVLRGVNVK